MQVIKRFVSILLLLWLVNVLGFGYAYFAQILYLKRSPFLSSNANLPPFFPAYFSYLQNLFTGTPTLFPPNPSVDGINLGKAMAMSGILALGVALISLPVGIWLGKVSVQHSPPRTQPTLLWSASLALGLPAFYLGAVFLLLAWRLPSSLGNGLLWVLPFLTLSIRPTLQIARFTANFLQAEFKKPYVLTARGYGKTWQDIRARDAFANIIAPLSAVVASSLRLLLAEMILVERLFNWEGVGRLFALAMVTARSTATRAQPTFLHPPLVAGLVTLFALLYFLIAWLAEIVANRADARLTVEQEAAEHA
ncbi:MAG TPA: ABC transporter permease subunit [Anaerolineales bacterium]|nr:ABC transporter permease subunit [Anaerolineales bacterium]